MKSLTKIISLTLLVAFLGLFSLGAIVDNSTNLSKHNNGIDCFGVGCGPVEHVVMHHYLVAEMSSGGQYIEFYYQNFAKVSSFLQSPEIVKESPPPKFSLV